MICFKNNTTKINVLWILLFFTSQKNMWWNCSWLTKFIRFTWKKYLDYFIQNMLTKIIALIILLNILLFNKIVNNYFSSGESISQIKYFTMQSNVNSKLCSLTNSFYQDNNCAFNCKIIFYILFKFQLHSRFNHWVNADCSL